MSVMTVEVAKYAKKIITSEKMIESGMALLGFLTSSPVVAIQSKPIKP